MEALSAPNCYEAWIAASTHLLRQRGSHESNLLVEVENPVEWNDEWFLRIDPRRVSSRGENPDNVANTIFPASTWEKSESRDEFYARYKRAHSRSRHKRWGTYFLRLIDFGQTHVNQLERSLGVFAEWEKNPGTAVVFHFSSAETDVPRPLGGPCLQLIQLQAWNNTIDMTAVYRNHDFFNKAFPNYVGLGRLLNFICEQSERNVGKLVCHSGHAYFNSSKQVAQNLLARV